MAHPVYGWLYHAAREDDYEVGLDTTQKHSGSKSAYLKSMVENPQPFGNLMQIFVAENYLGKRLRMKTWVRTELDQGKAQLWIRVDGDWKSASLKGGCFDNMNDRPILGATEWTEYELVVDVPEESTKINFGVMLTGRGQLWIDDVSFEVVPETIALTGSFTKYGGGHCGKIEPINLSFEDEGPLEFMDRARKFKQL